MDEDGQSVGGELAGQVLDDLGDGVGVGPVADHHEDEFAVSSSQAPGCGRGEIPQASGRLPYPRRGARGDATLADPVEDIAYRCPGDTGLPCDVCAGDAASALHPAGPTRLGLGTPFAGGVRSADAW